MTLIIISPPTFRKDEPQIINTLFEQGLDFFHFRKRDISKEDFMFYFNSIDKKFINRFIINDRDINLNKNINFDKIHFQKDFPKVKPPYYSTSFHSEKEVLSSAFPFQQAYLSPVFDSISKKGYKRSFSEEELHRINKKSPIPLIALGGINPNRVQFCFECGFHGVAVLGWLWQKTKINHIIESFHELKESCKNAHLSFQ